MNNSDWYELIDENTIDAFEYDERLCEFLDKHYQTTYQDLNMDDEITSLTDKIYYPNDYEYIEEAYDIACIMYPLVKTDPLLNPRLRLVNMCFVFRRAFNRLLDRISEVNDDIYTEDEKMKEVENN